jgi:hypothetical protein
MEDLNDVSMPTEEEVANHANQPTREDDDAEIEYIDDYPTREGEQTTRQRLKPPKKYFSTKNKIWDNLDPNLIHKPVKVGREKYRTESQKQEQRTITYNKQLRKQRGLKPTEVSNLKNFINSTKGGATWVRNNFNEYWDTLKESVLESIAPTEPIVEPNPEPIVEPEPIFVPVFNSGSGKVVMAKRATAPTGNSNFYRNFDYQQVRKNRRDLYIQQQRKRRLQLYAAKRKDGSWINNINNNIGFQTPPRMVTPKVGAPIKQKYKFRRNAESARGVLVYQRNQNQYNSPHVVNSQRPEPKLGYAANVSHNYSRYDPWIKLKYYKKKKKFNRYFGYE